MTIDKLSTLSEENKCALYQEYAQRARHYHLLIWTNIGIALPAALFGIWGFRELERAPYAIVGAGFIVLIFFANLMAEGHRRQWKQAIQVANEIEATWGLREKGTTHPLIGLDEKTGYVKRARRFFVLMCGILWAVAIIFKWLRFW